MMKQRAKSGLVLLSLLSFFTCPHSSLADTAGIKNNGFNCKYRNSIAHCVVENNSCKNSVFNAGHKNVGLSVDSNKRLFNYNQTNDVPFDFDGDTAVARLFGTGQHKGSIFRLRFNRFSGVLEVTKLSKLSASESSTWLKTLPVDQDGYVEVLSHNYDCKPAEPLF